MQHKIHSKGYHQLVFHVNNKRKTFFIHRIVGMAWIENPNNKPCINHKDGDKNNNHYSNLEWCTNAENNKHAKENGLFWGSNSKIPKKDRRFIVDNFYTIGRFKLAEMFGLTDEYIMNIASRERLKVSGTEMRKKPPIKEKEIVDTVTGAIYTSTELALKLKTSRKEIRRMIAEENKPNESPYKYTGSWIHK